MRMVCEEAHVACRAKSGPLWFQGKLAVPPCLSAGTLGAARPAPVCISALPGDDKSSGCSGRVQEALLQTLPLCLLPHLALNPAQSGHCVLPRPEPLLGVRGLLFRSSPVLEHCTSWLRSSVSVWEGEECRFPGVLKPHPSR